MAGNYTTDDFAADRSAVKSHAEDGKKGEAHSGGFAHAGQGAADDGGEGGEASGTNPAEEAEEREESTKKFLASCDPGNRLCPLGVECPECRGQDEGEGVANDSPIFF